MDKIIQFAGILFLLSICLKFRRLWLNYLSILLLTNFFGFIEPSSLAIKGLNLTSYFAVLLNILGYFYNALFFGFKPYNDLKYEFLFKWFKIFFFIQLFSYVLTIFRGYSIIESLLPFFDFIPYILIIPLYKLFNVVSEQEFYRYLKYIYIFSILNMVIYISNVTGLLTFYDSSKFSNVEGYEDVVRTLIGFPVYFAFIFPFIYLNLRKDSTFKNIALFLLLILILLLTATRSLVLIYGLIIITVELYYLFKNPSKKVFKVFAIISLSGLLVGSVFNRNTEAFASRFKESEKLIEAKNVKYRYEVAKERISMTLKNNPVFGLGFIYKNDVYRLNLKVDKSRLIHPDIFWPNLLTTTGLAGFVIFLVLYFKLFSLFNLRSETDLNIVFFLYLIITLLLTFSSGGVLFKGSINWTIIMAMGLVHLKYNEEKIASNENDRDFSPGY